MKKLYTADKTTGSFIDAVSSIEEGLKLIKEYEKADKEDGSFEADFYDIVDENHCTVMKAENTMKQRNVYRDVDTGECYTEDEIKKVCEQFYHEIVDAEGNPLFESAEDYFNHLLKTGGIEKISFWYAIMADPDDADWGYGSESLEEAKQMAKDLNEKAYIAVIDTTGNDTICVAEVYQDNFDQCGDAWTEPKHFQI